MPFLVTNYRAYYSFYFSFKADHMVISYIILNFLGSILGSCLLGLFILTISFSVYSQVVICFSNLKADYTHYICILRFFFSFSEAGISKDQAFLGNLAEHSSSIINDNSTFSAITYSRDMLTSLSCNKCAYCDTLLPSRPLLQKHMNEFHRELKVLPFICEDVSCQKGFFSLTGLRHHQEAHKGPQHACNACNARFVHKHHLKRHMERVHKLRECRVCLQVVHSEEFNSHVKYCQPPV